MKKKSYFRWGVIGLFALLVVCLQVGAVYLFTYKGRAFDSRPLVLIHSPLQHEQVQSGDGVIVYATARGDEGLARMEFWVDDALLASRNAPDSALTSLVLTTDWVPTVVGNHVLIVRALTVNGTEGQSSLVVEVLEMDDEAMVTHLAQEGETLESIASDYGTTPEDYVVDEDSGHLQLHIRNTGTATWPWSVLDIGLQSRDGSSLGVYT
ncbi:MAG: hypothetical protein A2Z14_16880 [Chloroflexi bacterium RBG_16_48_8]|nr:MAG: hypothetical protein A2Z14_16880 [Chloroflexi bacterium RBG_16_48_8]